MSDHFATFRSKGFKNSRALEKKCRGCNKSIALSLRKGRVGTTVLNELSFVQSGMEFNQASLLRCLTWAVHCEQYILKNNQMDEDFLKASRRHKNNVCKEDPKSEIVSQCYCKQVIRVCARMVTKILCSIFLHL